MLASASLVAPSCARWHVTSAMFERLMGQLAASRNVQGGHAVDTGSARGSSPVCTSTTGRRAGSRGLRPCGSARRSAISSPESCSKANGLGSNEPTTSPGTSTSGSASSSAPTALSYTSSAPTSASTSASYRRFDPVWRSIENIEQRAASVSALQVRILLPRRFGVSSTVRARRLHTDTPTQAAECELADQLLGYDRIGRCHVGYRWCYTACRCSSGNQVNLKTGTIVLFVPCGHGKWKNQQHLVCGSANGTNRIVR